MSTNTDITPTPERASGIDDSILYKELSRIPLPSQPPSSSSTPNDAGSPKPVDIVAELDAFRVILDSMALRLETSVPDSQVRFVQDLKALEDNLRGYVGPSPQFEVPSLDKFAAAFSSTIEATLSAVSDEQQKINDAVIRTKRDSLLKAIATSASNDKAQLNVNGSADATRVLLCIESALIDCADLSQESKVHVRDSFRDLLSPAQPQAPKPAPANARKDSNVSAGKATTTVGPSPSSPGITSEITTMAANGVANWPANPSSVYPNLSAAIGLVLTQSPPNVGAIRDTLVTRLKTRYPALVPESLKADPITLQSWVTTSLDEIARESRVAPLDQLTTDTMGALRDALVQSALQLIPNNESMSFATALKQEVLANLAKLSTPTGSSPNRPATRDEAIQMAFDKYAASGVQGQFLAASANLHDVKALQTSVLAAIDIIRDDITNGFPNSYAQLALKTAQAVSAAWGDHRTFINAHNGLLKTAGKPELPMTQDGPDAVSSAAQVVQMAGQLKPFVDGRLAGDRSLMDKAIHLIVDAYDKALAKEYDALQGSKDGYFKALDRYMNSKMLLDVQRHEAEAVREARSQLVSLFP